MRKLLLQLDSSRHASVFDRIVAYDAGADDVLSYAGVEEEDVRDLLHGCIFTRSPKKLHHTACFIGGAEMDAGERLLDAAKAAFFGPFRVSLMLDSNGSNTTAVAAFEKIRTVLPEPSGSTAVVLAGTGPVGVRVAGLLAAAGATVRITSRTSQHGAAAQTAIISRFGGDVTAHTPHDQRALAQLLDDAAILCNCGPAGVQLVERATWESSSALRVVVDLNAVPPLGVDGVEATDDGATNGRIARFGALGVGGLKMKIHRACIERLFHRNDLVLDAESIAELARSLPD